MSREIFQVSVAGGGFDLLLGGIKWQAENLLGTTILSIDSQMESVFVMIAAPVVGLSVDHFGLWPVGVFGATAAIAVLLYQRGSFGHNG